MCGILGYSSFDKVNEARFVESLQLLDHRGPDSEGLMYFDNLALGVKRLAIQDLSPAGAMPMSDEDGQVWIAYNGEVYNFLEIRRELELLGISFRSKTDTEVIINGYKAWGWEAMIQRLEGMFAFALYDRRQHLLLMARDRYGMKPLFFSRLGRGIIFASEIKAILNYKGSGQINLFNSANALFTTGLCPPSTTMFEGVEQLEPGHYLKLDLTDYNLSTHQYFSLSEYVSQERYQEIASMTHREVNDLYRKTLLESVRKHLISDAGLGVMFSGGLDSSVVAACATEVGGRTPSLYFFSSMGDGFEHYADKYATAFDADLTVVPEDPQALVLELPRMVYHYETVNKDEGAALARTCSAAQEQGHKVLLTGDAADELFGGYYHQHSFRFRSLAWNNKCLRFLQRALDRMFPGFSRWGDDPVGTDYFMSPSGLNFLETPVDILFHRGQRIGNWRRCLDTYSFIENVPESQTMAYLLDSVSYRLQRFLIRADRYGMMESVELRLPYLDNELVRLVLNTPAKYRIGTNVFSRRSDFYSMVDGKVVLKSVANSLGVPPGIVYRTKEGTPTDRTHINHIFRQWRLTFLSDLLEVPEDQLKRNVQDAYDPYVDRTVWSFITTEILMRMFVGGESHESITEEFRGMISTT